MKKSRPKQSIGIAECAKLTGLTARALRIYEREGLINPTRSHNGWRLYTQMDLVGLNAIVALKGMGFTLVQIRETLSSSPPALRRVLHMQLQVWQKHRVSAEEGLQLVRAALASLDAQERLSLADLCNLARKIEMAIPQETMREVINATISAEEERVWMTWWAKRPRAETETLQQYSSAQRAVMSELGKLHAAGATPDSADAQRLLRQWTANLTRFRARELMLEMMDWNRPLTRKWLAVGERATERTVASADPSVNKSIWHFLRAAFKASQVGSSLEVLLNEIRSAASDGELQHETHDKAFAERFVDLCREYELGDPVVYARWTCGMGILSDTGERVDLTPADQSAWEYLIKSLNHAH